MNQADEHSSKRLADLVEELYAHIPRQPTEEWPDLELTMPQLRALLLLRQGPQRMGDIAAYLGTTVPSATRMMDRLVGKDLVERQHEESDRRVVTCRLTAAGVHQVDEFWRMGRLQIDQIAGLLTEPELEEVVQAMDVLLAAVRRQHDHQGMRPHSDIKTV